MNPPLAQAKLAQADAKRYENLVNTRRRFAQRLR